MKAHECYHCRTWVQKDEPHDCWTTTEAALTRDLSEDLREAWERLRQTAVEFGEQRIYASHSSIMFSRKACYFFVRPKMKVLEVCVFLGRTLKSPKVRKAVASSRAKVAHLVHAKHRDEVEGSWRMCQPLLESQALPASIETYTPGTWGPPAADAVLKRDGRHWHNP